MAKHNDTGRWGEDLACDMLVADGWAIVGSGRPFGRNGISSTGRTRETTPLLP